MCYTRGLAVLANAKLNPLPLLYLNEQPSTITSRVQVSCVYLYFVHASVTERPRARSCETLYMWIGGRAGRIGTSVNLVQNDWGMISHTEQMRFQGG